MFISKEPTITINGYILPKSALNEITINENDCYNDHDMAIIFTKCNMLMPMLYDLKDFERYINEMDDCDDKNLIRLKQICEFILIKLKHTDFRVFHDVNIMISLVNTFCRNRSYNVKDVKQIYDTMKTKERFATQKEKNKKLYSRMKK